ncbi:SPOR domain-containing protein [Qipengyuania qiaonensis]|uniref:SPOR domain-containing protein n=1 Tax=Qipengyuania qiaonensis TaxID=2867240 RepID=A0ABS7JC41_9SPHN|nr:SPOR domain-containing protein [Qipengyuania qiaonensis]MBX7483253.1 SPOR domain-containing protein [Qipengyuania qiaonensis]
MASPPYGTDEEWEGEGQLDLADDESLPWLEAGVDDEEAARFDTSRLVLVGLLVAALLGVVGGGVWFLTSQASDEPEPDGSLIAAPDEPYKTKPENPGGKTFAGTGDTSFAVGEGQTREGKLAEPSVAPQNEVGASAGPSIASTVDEAPRTAQTSGTAVQVGAYPSREDAEMAWSNITRQTEVLNGVRHRVVEAQVDIGRVFRLQAMAGDRAAANRLCAALKGDGLACFVK